jgi:hypothetical protein
MCVLHPPRNQWSEFLEYILVFFSFTTTSGTGWEIRFTTSLKQHILMKLVKAILHLIAQKFAFCNFGYFFYLFLLISSWNMAEPSAETSWAKGPCFNLGRKPLRINIYLKTTRTAYNLFQKQILNSNKRSSSSHVLEEVINRAYQTKVSSTIFSTRIFKLKFPWSTCGIHILLKVPLNMLAAVKNWKSTSALQEK